MPTNRRAAVYLRISRDDLATGLAVERQREDSMAIIASRGWEFVGEFVDNAVSASKRDVKRPGYDRMVAAYAAGAFDALVCYDLDRLTRQPRQLEDWIDASEERGLVLVTANGEADLETDGGRMYARIKASVARAEVERKGARQRRANEQRTEQGKPAPGRRRYGYEVNGLTPREQEAVVVRRMFEHVAGGGSIRSMARALTAEAVDPAPGRSWSPGRVRYILTNPTYSGEVHRRGAALPSNVIVPVVDTALAVEVRAILADAARTVTPGPTPRYLASGLASCGVCGALMFNLAHAYRCKADASHPTITRERLDARLRTEVARAVLSATGRDLLDDRQSEALAPLIRALERNDDAASATAADRDEGLLSPTAARARLIDLRAERESLDARIASTRVDRTATSVLATVAYALVGDATEWTMAEYDDLVADVAKRFAALDIDRQRDTVRALLDVTVHPGRDPRRVVVWHLLAVDLNPDAATNHHDADGTSSGPSTGAKRQAPRPSRAAA